MAVGEIRESRRVRVPDGTAAAADFTIITSDYFETLRLPILSGRPFAAAEDERIRGIPPVLVNDRLARRLFGTENPIGRPLMMSRRTGEAEQTFIVAGIVPGTVHDLFDPEPEPHLYGAYGSNYQASMNLLVATAPGADAASTLALVQRELRQLDASLPIVTARTMSAHRDASLPQWGMKAAAVLFSTFAAVALLLATIGIYGLKAYDVARRTREIGIRMALGATGTDVTWLVVTQGLRATAIGLIAGLALALGLGRLVSSLLYNVSPSDPATLTVAATALAAATFLASYLPARRATRIAPVEALRTE